MEVQCHGKIQNVATSTTPRGNSKDAQTLVGTRHPKGKCQAYGFSTFYGVVQMRFDLDIHYVRKTREGGKKRQTCKKCEEQDTIW